MKSFFAEHAWLGGESCASNVRITIDKGSFVSIDTNAVPNSKDSRIAGVVMPGFVTRIVTHFIEHYAVALTVVLASVTFGLGAH